MKKAILDHIAVAVESIERAQKIYEDLGLTFSPEREVVSSQQVTTAFASIDQNAHLELLEPLEGAGPIQQFIEKRGPGIHHLCFRVEDVASHCQDLRSQGYQLLYDTPVEGAGGCLVNFIHPKSTGGVLIELSQKVIP